AEVLGAVLERLQAFLAPMDDGADGVLAALAGGLRQADRAGGDGAVLPGIDLEAAAGAVQELAGRDQRSAGAGRGVDGGHDPSWVSIAMRPFFRGEARRMPS